MTCRDRSLLIVGVGNEGAGVRMMRNAGKRNEGVSEECWKKERTSEGVRNAGRRNERVRE